MNLVNTGGRALTDEQAEEAIREEPTLTFKKFTYTNQSVEEMVHEFFKHSWMEYTYDNKGRSVCGTGKNRSFTDIYSFILHYIPELDIKELKAVILKLLESGTIVNDYCGGIKRSIFYYPGQHISKNHTYLWENRKNFATEFNKSIGEFLK